MFAVAIAVASSIEAQQTDVDAVASIVIIKAKGAFFLVYLLRRTRWRQCREGGAEMRAGHVGSISWSRRGDRIELGRRGGISTFSSAS